MIFGKYCTKLLCRNAQWLGLFCCFPWSVCADAHSIISEKPLALLSIVRDPDEDEPNQTDSEPEPDSEKIPQDVQSPEPAVQTEPEEMPNESNPPLEDAANPISAATAGIAPLHRANLALDVLYWQAMEDDLRYGVKNWTALYPSSPAVNQKLEYDPGVRASVFVPIASDFWRVGVIYTRFYTTPPTTSAYDPNGNIYANLNFAVIGTDCLQRVYRAQGQWTLHMNILEFELKRPFVVGRSLMIQPSMGGKACIVRQRIDVRYQYVVQSSSNARRIRGLSSVRAIGPEAGLEIGYLFPKHFRLTLKGTIAAMLGIFKGNTVYSEYYGVDYETALTETKHRLFEVGALQCGLSKWWEFKQNGSLEAMIGWESQIWWRQMRVNWWSTTTQNNQGADLALNGPFFRMALNF